MRREATAQFERVVAGAVETDDDGYQWSFVSPAEEPGQFTVRPTDESLYFGRCGIALLGAGLYEVTGEPRYRSFALQTVAPVREAISTGTAIPSVSHLGGTLGVGSVAYGLATVGDLLGDESVVSDGVRAAEFLTSDLIDSDRSYDVSDGAAGTILGLLGAYDRLESPELLAKAVECGDHLLDSRVGTDGGFRVWKGADDHPPLTGFSHGMAGIAYSLGRLADATGDDAYREAAIEAVEYESRAYDESVGNWEDYRQAGNPYPNRWCYGRAGIGLARLGMAEYVDADVVERGIDRAVSAASADEPSGLDHLCCGNAGRAEFLLEAAGRRGRCVGEAGRLLRCRLRDGPDAGTRGRCVGEAGRLLGAVLSRKEETGHYRTVAKTGAVLQPTLYHGVSGIAYSMLRATAPDELPCLPLWE